MLPRLHPHAAAPGPGLRDRLAAPSAPRHTHEPCPPRLCRHTSQSALCEQAGFEIRRTGYNFCLSYFVQDLEQITLSSLNLNSPSWKMGICAMHMFRVELGVL